MAFFFLTNMIICHILLSENDLLQGGVRMDFTVFKDMIFDLINECDAFDIETIQSFDKENRFVVNLSDRQSFEIALRDLSGTSSPIPINVSSSFK